MGHWSLLSSFAFFSVRKIQNNHSFRFCFQIWFLCSLPSHHYISIEFPVKASMKCIGERDRGALRQPPQLSGRKNINGPPPSSCALSMQKTLSAGKCEKNKNLDLIKTLSAKVHVRFVFN